MRAIFDSKVSSDGKNRTSPAMKCHGKARGSRDKTLEKIVSGNCVICEKGLTRKTYRSGRLEGWRQFRRRKTCGKYADELGHFKNSPCLTKWFSIPENNGRYKGIMPTCEDCGVKISYPTQKEQKTGSGPKKCRECFMVWAEKTDYFAGRPQSLQIAQEARKRRGIQPEALKPYIYKKGRTSEKKIYFDGSECKIEECKNKPVAH